MRRSNVRMMPPVYVQQQPINHPAQLPTVDPGQLIQELAKQLALQMVQQNEKTEPMNEKIDVKEASAILGCSIYKTYELARENKLPCYRIGNRILFRRSKLLEWIERQEEAHV